MIFKKEIIYAHEKDGVRKYYIFCKLSDKSYHVFKSDVIYFDEKLVSGDEDDEYYRDYISEILEMEFFDSIDAAINSFNKQF